MTVIRPLPTADDFGTVVDLVYNEPQILRRPQLDMHFDIFMNLQNYAHVLPSLLLVDTVLIPPSTGSRRYFRGDVDKSFMFFEYEAAVPSPLTVIIKICGMSPQTITLTYDNRHDRSDPVKLFLPAATGL